MDTTAQNLLDALAQPGILIDSAGRIAGLNRPARDIFGDRVIGRGYGMALRQPAVLAAIRSGREEGDVSEVRVVLRGSSNLDRVYLLRVSPISDGEGRGLLLLFESLTEFEANLRMRQDFIADVSHELKTPLAAVSGFIETLAGPAKDDAGARAHFLSMMTSEVDRMIALVDDLLQLARIEARGGKGQRERLDLLTVIRDAVASLEARGTPDGISIKLEMSEGSATILGHRDAILRMVSNLLENAVLHSEGTEIRIGFEIARDGARSEARLFVEDNGKGIEPQHLPRITERFYRVDGHRARSGAGGTGLGLSIVKHVAQAHDGRLAIRSHPGSGTRFDVNLPLSEVETNL